MLSYRPQLLASSTAEVNMPPIRLRGGGRKTAAFNHYMTIETCVHGKFTG